MGRRGRRGNGPDLRPSAQTRCIELASPLSGAQRAPRARRVLSGRCSAMRSGYRVAIANHCRVSSSLMVRPIRMKSQTKAAETTSQVSFWL